MPDAANFTSTSPGPGGSSSISSTLQGAPVSHRIAAFVLIRSPPCAVGNRQRGHYSTLGRLRPAEDGVDLDVPVTVLGRSSLCLHRRPLGGETGGERLDLVGEQGRCPVA